jgi:hypothetical protein
VDRPSVIKGRIAHAVRFDQPAEVVEELRRDYYAARARDYLVTWLSSDPRPTAEHRSELASLLVGGDADAAAA